MAGTHRLSLLRKATAIGWIVALGSCAAIPTKTPFDTQQKAFAARQVGKGSGRVSGYAFIHADSGRTYTAAGDWVRMIPATDYARERLRNLFGQVRFRPISLLATRVDAPDPDYVASTRLVKADIHGRFEFEDVMPGPWFVIADVSWTRYDESYHYEIYDEFDVKAGETTKVVLSGN